jgi:hypothetical protein
LFLETVNWHTSFGLTRPSSVVIEYSPPEVVALLYQFYHIGENWHNRAAASGGEYSITDDGRVRPKHVSIEFKK